MRKTSLLCGICLFICSLHLAAKVVPNEPTTANVSQNDESPTLFSFGKDKVNKNEFMYVYEKHNSTDSLIYSQKSIDEYLELYINFKLKVKEAEALGIDTLQRIQAELEKYKGQLAQNYLYDKDVSETMLRETYDRMSKEVKTSHILIMVNEKALPQDTIVAFKKAINIHKLITEQGEDFAKMANKYSQDPSVTENDGNLGYITAFQTVYPFETAAYHTPVGTISQPVRTKFGYHLVKVEDVRPAQGKVQTAHILVKVSKDDSEAVQKEKEKIAKDIWKKANKKNAVFEDLAKQYSDDKTSSNQGGILPWFSSGSMLEEFENAAFALEKKGDISKPVCTKIGWHIIKLIDKQQLGAYDDVKMDIKKKIERDSRSKVSQNVFLERLKKDYNYEFLKKTKADFISKVDNTILRSQWKASSFPADMNETLFTLSFERNGKSEKLTFGQQEFAKYIEINQVKDISKTAIARCERLYDMFVKEKLLEVEESMLEYKYPDFARLLKEFRDGNLLYELMGEKVWTKAMQDTTGLQTFFESNKDKYLWKNRANAAIFYFNNEGLAKETRKKIKDLDEEGVKKMETELKENGGMLNMRIDKGVYEKEQNKMIDQMNFKTGTSDVIANNDGTYSLVKIFDIIAPAPKKLEEARGYVIADYQSELEKAWIEELRTKYPVKIDNKVLKTLYK